MGESNFNTRPEPAKPEGILNGDVSGFLEFAEDLERAIDDVLDSDRSDDYTVRERAVLRLLRRGCKVLSEAGQLQGTPDEALN